MTTANAGATATAATTQTTTSTSNGSGSGMPASTAAVAPEGFAGASPPDRPQRPDWLAEQFWDAEKGEIKGADLKAYLDDLAAFKAAEDSRRAAVPEKPDAYELKLPADWKAPDGFDFQLDANDPMVNFGRQIAHQLGLDQAGFERLVGEYAKHQIAELQNIEALKGKQLEALGPKGADRVAAVKNFLTAKLGPEVMPFFEHLLQFAPAVEGLERLIRTVTSGGPGFTQAGREKAGAGQIEGWDRMTPAQKFMAARQRLGMARG